MNTMMLILMAVMQIFVLSFLYERMNGRSEEDVRGLTLAMIFLGVSFILLDGYFFIAKILLGR